MDFLRRRSAGARGGRFEPPAPVEEPDAPPAIPAEYSLDRTTTRPVYVPAQIDQGWIDYELPRLSSSRIKLVVNELDRRGWPPRDVALATLPHLLPKLPPEDAEAILAGVRSIGLTEEEVARLRRTF